MRGKPIRTPYFLKQLQVLYEGDFFPWVVSDALKILEQERFLVSFTSDTIPNITKLRNVPKLKFYANAAAITNNADYDRMKRHAFSLANVVNEYSDYEITSHIGKHLETMLWYELRALGFNIIGTNTNEYKGKKWTISNRDLDIIAEHSSGKLAIGLEAKNTLEIISKDELNEKIAICNFLGITPVFAVRWIKPYTEIVYNSGGYSWVFKALLYPPPYHNLVKRIYEQLSVLTRFDSKNHRLDFPIIDRATLPEGSVKNFKLWVENKIK